MGHPYIFLDKNDGKGRTVVFPDSVLLLFMCFFNEVAEPNVKPNTGQSLICGHYRIELLEIHNTFMDAMLQEVSEDKELKTWYLWILSLLELRISNFGEYIDNHYLNQIPELLIGWNPNEVVFSKPIPTSLLKNLINDIRWLLKIANATPPGQYKWFVS